MKDTRLDSLIVYRACAPIHMATASSIKGSLVSPGRFNERGVPALYTSFEPETAYAEYQQGAPEPRPAIIVALRVTLSQVVDFRKGYNPRTWSPIWTDALRDDWRLVVARAAAGGRAWDGWACGEAARAAGASSILFPSLRRAKGINLVIFLENLKFAADSLHDLDPHGDVKAALAALKRARRGKGVAGKGVS